MNIRMKPGDRLIDNDPRMPNRFLRIEAVLPDRVLACDSINRLRWYRIKRIHFDSKPRKSGFTWEAA